MQEAERGEQSSGLQSRTTLADGRENKQGNDSGRGGTSEQEHPVLGKGGRRTRTRGVELAEDCLQEKMEIGHCSCRQRGWDRCVPGQAVGEDGVRMGDGSVSTLGPFPSDVLS